MKVLGAHGTHESIRTTADLVFLEIAYGLLCHANPVIASVSDIGAENLADLLRKADFCPSHDCDADSYSTQSAHFDDEALRLALTLVTSADEATRTAIAQAI